MLLLVLALYALFIRLPYCSLDSDAVNFGLMGEDLYTYGHLPSLAYGQNYLLSITPYLYAAFKALLPKTVPWAYILAAAGGVLSLSGLWMIFRSFVATADQTQRRSGVALVLFLLLLLGLPKHLFDYGGNASTELGYFVTGLLMLSASRLAAALRAGQLPSWRWWALAGLAFGYGMFSRPQVCAYGLIPLVLLAGQQWRIGPGRKFLTACAWLAAGLLGGSLPMILHRLFRAATWPFGMELGSHWADAAALREQFDVLIHKVIPTLFSFDDRWGPPTYQEELVLLWVAAAITGYLYFLVRRRGEMTPMDHGWFWGPWIVLAIMLTHTHMISDQSNRRYCLQIVEAMIWLFCRFCVPVRRPMASNRPAAARAPMLLAVGLILLLLMSSVVSWRDVVTEKLKKNTFYKHMVRGHLVPELERQHAVIIADYWDAYILLFLSEGRLRVEAQPWFWVRTYGRISAAEMQRNTLWLARNGVTHTAMRMLQQGLGPKALDNLTSIPVEAKWGDLSCELWRLTDTNAAVTLMQKYHPRYFATPYPPGS